MQPSSKSVQKPVPPSPAIFFGKTQAMQAVQQELQAVARTRVPVLIQGESGTGKELCVEMLHQLSGAPPASLIKVSCPALPQALLETELFGYQKGAFTGAQSTKRGRVEQAHGGTLFLDEVGSLDIATQSKLLQILQDGTFMRVGGHETHHVDARLICVANQDLKQQVAAGAFRLDFLYRINTITIEIPPLRRRLEDLPALVGYFLEQNTRLFEIQRPPLSQALVRQMQHYYWPGNIRQLENFVRRYVLLGDGDALMAELIESQDDYESLPKVLDLSAPVSLKLITRRATQDLERQIILRVLKAKGWNRQKTAKWLKISYRSLLYKLDELSTMDPLAVPVASPPAPEKATPTPSAFRTAPRLM